jgi:transposase
MLLSLLVYGIAERRMRACLAEQKETLPNQIHQAVEKPTLR